MRLLAQHSGQLVNYSTLGSGIGVSYKTGQRYVGLLEQVFLIATLQPWHTNAVKRIIKTPCCISSIAGSSAPAEA